VVYACFDTNTLEIFYEQLSVPKKEAFESLKALDDAKNKMMILNDDFACKKIAEIRRHYILILEAECKIDEIIKGSPTNQFVKIIFNRPIDGYPYIPSPWTFTKGSEYVVFLKKINSAYALIDQFQGAEFAGESGGQNTRKRSRGKMRGRKRAQNACPPRSDFLKTEGATCVRNETDAGGRLAGTRRSRWRRPASEPDCGSLVYGISKIKIP
jgi:hypothetical protein